MTPLHWAVKQGNLVRLQHLLLAPETEIDALDAFGHTALYYACNGVRFDIAVELLDAGAAVDMTRAGEATPLQRAVIKGDEEMVGLLLDHEANPNTYLEGMTALAWACTCYPFKKTIIYKLLSG